MRQLQQIRSWDPVAAKPPCGEDPQEQHAPEDDEGRRRPVRIASEGQRGAGDH